MSLSERFDDNVFLVRDSRTYDFVTVVAPRVSLSPLAGPWTGSIQYSPRYEAYARTEDLTTLNHFADLDWTMSLSKAVTLDFSDHFAATPDSTAVSTIGVAVPRGDVFANDATVRFGFPHLDLSYSNYVQAFESADLSDSLSHTADERLAFPFLPRLEFTQRYGLRYFTQDGEVAFRSHTAGAGARYRRATFSLGFETGATYWRGSAEDSFQLDPMYRVELMKSFRQFRGEFSWLRDFQDQFSGALEYAGRKTTIRAGLTRALAAGGGVLGGAADSRGATLFVGRTLGPNLRASLSGEYRITKIVDAPDRFDSTIAGVGLSYQLDDWLSADLSYLYYRQNASGVPVGQEFLRNLGTVSLTATLP